MHSRVDVCNVFKFLLDLSLILFLQGAPAVQLLCQGKSCSHTVVNFSVHISGSSSMLNELIKDNPPLKTTLGVLIFGTV